MFGSHEWLTKQKADSNEEKADENDTKVAIILIGNSGVGKSSLSQLLSGDIEKVRISSKTERGTSEITTVKSKYNSNIYYIDTVGLQDYDSKWTDSKLLKRILQYIHCKGFSAIKILFCISGDTKTRKGPFIDIAKFIQSLQIKENDKLNDKKNANVSIWDSVLIIKKEGEPYDDLSGVWNAALSNGATNNFINIDKHFFGFTCTDWNNFDKNHNKWYKKLNHDEYEKHGFFTEERAKIVIENKLNELPIFSLKFKYEICVRCGCEGDSRYIEAKCHTKSEKCHIEPLSLRHLQQQKYKHIGNIKTEMVTVGWTHTGYKENKHSGNKIGYHPGQIKKGSYSRIASGILSLSTTEWLVSDSSKWHWYSCCNKYVSKAKPCAYKWSCCQDQKSCIQTWSCCNKYISDKGCKEIPFKVKFWDCCNKSVEEKGCELIWMCCYQTHDGCDVFYPCCNEPENSIGCTKKCINCKVDWGKGPGCISIN